MEHLLAVVVIAHSGSPAIPLLFERECDFRKLASRFVKLLLVTVGASKAFPRDLYLTCTLCLRGTTKDWTSSFTKGCLLKIQVCRGGSSSNGTLV